MAIDKFILWSEELILNLKMEFVMSEGKNDNFTTPLSSQTKTGDELTTNVYS